MKKSLVRCVYRSRSNLHPDNAAELDKIFKTSIRNNRNRNLSGCLAHPDGYFVQVIEGEETAVSSLMDRLVVDERHTDIVVLGRWHTPARIFSSWAMAKPDIRPLKDQGFRRIHELGSGAQITALLLALMEKSTSFYPLI